MRTDVKIGLVCAFLIVMGAIIYFVSQSGTGTPKQTVKNDKPAPVAETPATAPSGSGSGGIGGTLILPPSSGSPAVAETPTTVPSMTGTPALATGTPATGTPSTMPATAPASTGTPTAFGTGNFGSPSILPPPVGTPASSGAAGTSTTPPSSGSSVASGRGATIEFGSSRPEPLNFPGPSTPSFGPNTMGTSAGATTYTIQKGDMLSTIAKRFNVSVRAIEAVNPGIDSTRLQIDKTINIPASTGTASAAGNGTVKPAAATPVAARTTPAPASTAKSGGTYKVKKGDTLITISRSVYGSEKNWQRIYQANKSSISNPDVVPVGLVIKLP